MKIKKSWWFSLSVIMICFAIMASGTMAYFVAEERMHNVITAGGIDIEIVEKTENSEGILVDFPREGFGKVMPGTAVSKLVSVQNIGMNEAWIRVLVEQKLLSENGSALSLILDKEIPAITFSVDSQKWIKKDDWYYYLAPVASGAVTDILFEEVQFASEMGNEYQGCTAHITVIAQAVQRANNGEAVMEAQGWPEEVDD